jgi:hypothetical protein
MFRVQKSWAENEKAAGPEGAAAEAGVALPIRDQQRRETAAWLRLSVGMTITVRTAIPANDRRVWRAVRGVMLGLADTLGSSFELPSLCF